MDKLFGKSRMELDIMVSETNTNKKHVELTFMLPCEQSAIDSKVPRNMWK